MLTVDTVEEHLRVRLNEEEDEVKKVVEAVPCNIQNIFTSVTAITAICPLKMPLLLKMELRKTFVN